MDTSWDILVHKYIRVYPRTNITFGTCLTKKRKILNSSSIFVHILSFPFTYSSFHLQVFVRAKVFFSIGGRQYIGEPVQFSYMPDIVLDHARDVTIKLHHRLGKYLQLHLYFAARWLMLSEITFISGKFVPLREVKNKRCQNEKIKFWGTVVFTKKLKKIFQLSTRPRIILTKYCKFYTK